jgi:hypothetical protein
MTCGETRFKRTHSRFIGLYVAMRLPSDEISMLGWSILAFCRSAILGVNGIKTTAYKHSIISASTVNAASPLSPEKILSRILRVESNNGPKYAASRLINHIASRKGILLVFTLFAQGGSISQRQHISTGHSTDTLAVRLARFSPRMHRQK